MFSIILAAGWPIWPLLFASIIAVALIIERLVALRRSKVVPPGLLQRVLGEFKPGGANDVLLADLDRHSPLGRVLAIGDSVRTDLRGAVDLGVDCLFLTAGIHAEELGDRDDPDTSALKKIFTDAGLMPKAVMRKLVW